MTIQELLEQNDLPNTYKEVFARSMRRRSRYLLRARFRP